MCFSFISRQSYEKITLLLRFLLEKNNLLHFQHYSSYFLKQRFIVDTIKQKFNEASVKIE